MQVKIPGTCAGVPALVKRDVVVTIPCSRQRLFNDSDIAVVPRMDDPVAVIRDFMLPGAVPGGDDPHRLTLDAAESSSRRTAAWYRLVFALPATGLAEIEGGRMDVRRDATHHTRRFTVTRFCSRSALSLVAVGLVALASLVSSGCSSGAGSSASPSSTGADNSKALEGKVWKATEISGVTTVLTEKGTEVTAAFVAGKLSGSGGVNRYTATYETQSGDKITISQPAATLMAGPPEAMAQEQAYFAALTKATKFAVTADSLTLMDDQGTTLVRYAVVQPTTLEGTEWHALAYNNGKGALQSLAASSAITATFGSDGSLAGNASINQYSTTYTTSGDAMSIDAQIVSTQMAGPADLMKQEAAYLAALPQTATYTIEGDELWLRDADGAALAHYVAK